MKRVLVTTLAIVFFTGYKIISGTLYELKNCKSEYNYISVNGDKGTSKHCFKDGNTFICRNIKRGVRAVKVQEKRICKWMKKKNK